jgi:hypothetical protein
MVQEIMLPPVYPPFSDRISARLKPAVTLAAKAESVNGTVVASPKASLSRRRSCTHVALFPRVRSGPGASVDHPGLLS